MFNDAEVMSVFLDLVTFWERVSAVPLRGMGIKLKDFLG